MDSQQRNLKAPSDWWAAFESAASASGKNLSQWVRDTCKASLPASIQKRLSEPKRAGRPWPKRNV